MNIYSYLFGYNPFSRNPSDLINDAENYKKSILPELRDLQSNLNKKKEEPFEFTKNHSEFVD